VDNLMRSRTLTIDQLSCLSRRWNIQPVLDKSKLHFNIKPGECVNYVFHVHGSSPKDEEEPASFIHACKMSCCTNPEKTEIDVLGDSSLLFVSAESFARWEAGEYGRAPKTKNNQVSSSSDESASESASFGLSSFGCIPSFVNAHLRADNRPVSNKVPDLDVIALHWSASSEDADKPEATKGFSIISQQASQLIQNIANMQCPVRLCVKAPSVFQHDFKTQPLCMVPVTITACNYSISKNLHVAFDALTPNNTTSEWQATAAKDISSNFFWAGLSNFSMETFIHPLESRSTTIHACFQRPGMYNLNSIKTIVTEETTGTTLYNSVLSGTQCLIEIKSA